MSGKDDLTLRFLYRTVPGRFLLKGLVRPGLSRAAGRFLSSRASRLLIGPFVRKNGIDLSGCERTDFRSFNDFFTRRLRPELRPVDREPDALVSPCDGLLSSYVITDGLVVPVKQSRFSLADLLGGTEDAARFEGGLCLVFRLRVSDYHRYAFFEGGTAHPPVSVPGRLHTVRPVALREIPVFTENARAVTLLDTDRCGRAAQIEVGALLVGRIDNLSARVPDPRPAHVERGQEKGMFLFGGSTVVVLLEKGRAELSEPFRSSLGGTTEIPVRLGARIGTLLS